MFYEWFWYTLFMLFDVGCFDTFTTFCLTLGFWWLLMVGFGGSVLWSMSFQVLMCCSFMQHLQKKVTNALKKVRQDWYCRTARANQNTKMSKKTIPKKPSEKQPPSWNHGTFSTTGNQPKALRKTSGFTQNGFALKSTGASLLPPQQQNAALLLPLNRRSLRRNNRWWFTSWPRNWVSNLLRKVQRNRGRSECLLQMGDLVLLNGDIFFGF